jgi:hypothetical protein
MMDFAGGEPGSETGEPPILTDKDKLCEECGSVHDIEVCPKCHSFITLGYGLMFGGIGEYKFCNNEACDWFWKREDEYEGPSPARPESETKP